jgi:hypothetical protein
MIRIAPEVAEPSEDSRPEDVVGILHATNPCACPWVAGATKSTMDRALAREPSTGRAFVSRLVGRRFADRAGLPPAGIAV